MTWEDVFKILAAAITSMGGAAFIIWRMSSWLGNVWAQRMLEKERYELRTDLEKAKRDLDVIKETTLRFQNDKILTYRAVVDIVARFLASLDSRHLGTLQPTEMTARIDELNEQRIRVYGYLAMFAPQAVMDAQDMLMDHLLTIFQGSVPYEWKKVRELAINFLNEVRKDIGIDKNPIGYNGEL
jgi:hypothetical protein